MQPQKALKVCWPYVVTLRNRTPTFEWCMAKIVVKNGTKMTPVLLRSDFVLNVYTLTINGFNNCYEHNLKRESSI